MPNQRTKTTDELRVLVKALNDKMLEARRAGFAINVHTRVWDATGDGTTFLNLVALTVSLRSMSEVIDPTHT